MAKKIAIVGTEPSSRDLAPWDDASWDIWVCSPRNKNAPRITKFFEVHSRDFNLAEGYGEYVDWLKTQPLVLLLPDEFYPDAEIVDLQTLYSMFGQRFFSSSIAWMLAVAITEAPEQINLYGVDMATNGEYADQRPGCFYFIEHAERRGIVVDAPPESDILAMPPLYGLTSYDPMWRKMFAKKKAFERDLREVERRRDINLRDESCLKTALEATDYVMRTFRSRK